MISRLLLAAIGVLAITANASASTLTPLAGPQTRLRADGEAVYDFGRVSVLDGPKIVHTFAVRNDSGAPVTVDRVVAACGCTSTAPTDAHGSAVKLPTTVLGGGTLGVQVSVDTAQVAAGQVHKQVWVYAGAEQPAVTLEMDGTIDAPLTISPTAVDFGRVDVDKAPAPSLTVTFDARLKGHLDGFQLISSDPDVVLTPMPFAAGGVVRNYRVSLATGVRLGVIDGNIVALLPSMPALRTVSSPLTGEIIGEVAASPSRVSFGDIDAGQSSTRQVVISCARPGALADATAISATPLLSARLEPVSTAGTRTLDITAGPQIPAGTLETQVIVKTVAGDLVLPVVLTVRKS